MLALRTAQAMGLSEDEQVTVFYTGLLHFAGCTAESEIDARFFGDELAARPRMLAVAHGSRLELIATAMRTAHQGSAPLARAAMMARAAFGGIAEFRKWAASHCDVAAYSAPGWACPGRSSSRCGTCTNGGTATACPGNFAARRSRWRYGSCRWPRTRTWPASTAGSRWRAAP
jgi:hypothetical protein